MSVPVTALYGSLIVLLYVVLGGNVSRLRGKFKVEDPRMPPLELHGAIRAHGNLAEYLPPALILLLVMELMGASSMTLHVFGGLFVLLRLSHAVGMLGHKGAFSLLGAAGTYLFLVAEVVYTLILRYR